MVAPAQRRERFRVRGVVQGVGFRPFVYRTACREGLVGFVRNDGAGVTIEAQGAPPALDAFASALEVEAPPLALVRSVRRDAVEGLGSEDAFRIATSEAGAGRDTLVSPDIATCDDCLKELADPADRRFAYPFLNCTHCGPRFTIIADVPYDRPSTAMRAFAMCPACQAEYDDPGDRRFHAQPTACPACGPHVRLLAPDGAPLATDDPIQFAAARLREGSVVAVKGLGGYHLACDGASEAAVATLRERKGRDEKPFAVMTPDLTTLRSFAEVDDREASLLVSRARPIVLVRKRRPIALGEAPTRGAPLADAVSPRNGWIGAMLPYTPLHHLLLQAFGGPLVMTSGNRSDEPIIHDDGEAVRALGPIADLLLVHDRPILVRADDSVMRLVGGVPRHLRRSRGFVPMPVFLTRAGARAVLATGAELKGAICLTRGDQAFPGQHLGDLKYAETMDFFEESVAHLTRILDARPALVVHDAHPDYLGTRWARERSGLPTLAVQHHHAHVLSCLAENGHDAPAVGLALDGTGYGLDGTVWGGEVLVVDGLAMERVAHAKPLPLPGGDRVAEEPWRMAVAALHDAFGAGALDGLADLPPLAVPPAGRVRGVRALLDGPMAGRLPRSSGLGRLFDAVAALVGVRQVVRYEGQAPLELEAAAGEADLDAAAPYPWEVREAEGRRVLDFAATVRGIVADFRAGHSVAALSGRFHRTVVEAFAEAARRAARDAGVAHVALTGGVFQNHLVLSAMTRRLERGGLRVLTHAQVPANDGGISLGQAWAGILELERRGERRSSILGGGTGNVRGSGWA